MRGRHRKARRVEPTDLIGAVVMLAALILGVALVSSQIGHVIVP